MEWAGGKGKVAKACRHEGGAAVVAAVAFWNAVQSAIRRAARRGQNETLIRINENLLNADSFPPTRKKTPVG